jgi:hypothetical protein|tara:strand:+ start:8595 stop:9869 length:1275 start_codon:yes stop_codon:yes gene_type:complete
MDQKKINYQLLKWSLIFFISINIIYFFLHLTSNIEVSAYAYNELFINYQAGFIRRGLLGELVWQLNDIFSIKPINFFSVFFLFIYLIQTFIFFYLFRNYIISKPIFVFLFFSPALIIFHIYNPDLYYIKDGIIKFTILLHAFIFYYFVILKKKNKIYLRYLKFLIIPILIFVILSHEYQIFSIGIHYLISIGIIQNKKEIKKIIQIYSILIIPVFLVLFFNGNQSQFDDLNIILSKFDVQLNNYLVGSLHRFIGGTYKWHLYYFSYRDFLYLLFSFFLGVYLFYLLFETLIQKKVLSFQSNFQKKYHIYFIPCFLPFFITSDHGRDFGLIAFYLIAFFSTLNLNKNELINFNNELSKNLINKSILGFFLIFYLFMWKLDQFAGFGFRETNTMFESSLFAEFVKLIKYLYFYIDLNLISLPEIKL